MPEDVPQGEAHNVLDEAVEHTAPNFVPSGGLCRRGERWPFGVGYSSSGSCSSPKKWLGISSSVRKHTTTPIRNPATSPASCGLIVDAFCAHARDWVDAAAVLLFPVADEPSGDQDAGHEPQSRGGERCESHGQRSFLVPGAGSVLRPKEDPCQVARANPASNQDILPMFHVERRILISVWEHGRCLAPAPGLRGCPPRRPRLS